jgi:hypothetical protein
MSGVSRRSAGIPLRKKRKPGPNSTSVVSTNCSIHEVRIPIVPMTKSWIQGIRCEPISSTKTGTVRAPATSSDRQSVLSSRSRVARSRSSCAGPASIWCGS